MARLLDDFRRHPIGRPNKRLGEGAIVKHVVFGVEVLQYLLACSEVGQLDDPIVIYQNICAFEVPVDDAIMVEVAETLQHLSCVDLHESLVKCEILIEQLTDRASRNKLQDNVYSLSIFGDIRLEISHYVRVGKGFQHSYFMFNSF